MRECAVNLVNVRTRALTTSSMTPTVIRNVNDAIIDSMDEGLAERGVVDKAVSVFIKTIFRSRTTYWKWRKGTGAKNTKALFEWMKKYVNHLFKKSEGKSSNIRHYLNKIVPDVFESEVRRTFITGEIAGDVNEDNEMVDDEFEKIYNELTIEK
jgi:hypothetical protein